jgi:hypothetical protein
MMVMHPNEILGNKITEKENLLWWELDKIAVEQSIPTPLDTGAERKKKADAAESMMRFLRKPTPDWCRKQYQADHAR